jgi:hypothetical protein
MFHAHVLLAQVATGLTQVPHASAARTAHPPTIDGRLDDPAWADAPEQDSFTQKFPNERQTPIGKTSFRVLYDDKAIYIGIDCEQVKVPVVARLTRRDRPIEADWVSVGIDARGDGRTAVELKVNAAGVLSDAIRFDDTDIDTDWDETWDASVARNDHGWSAEIRVPLRILRFSTGTAGGEWGLQVRRYTSLARETDEWAYIPRSAAGEVSRYGKLSGVAAIQGGGFVELRPFVVGRLDRSDPGTETLRKGLHLGGSAGFDAKWHAKNDLTLDFSLLPDFAQVEADQLILNLTNEEIQLPEKRPFFFEGRDVFATPMPLLYTRRIGRIAPSTPELATGEQLVDPTDPAKLLGAAKLTGRIGEGLRFGSLSALTAANIVDVERPDGTLARRLVEPRTLFQALRLRQELSGNSTVGLFASSVTRAEETTRYLRDDTSTICPDGTNVAPGARCTHDAYVGAVDGRWRSQSGDWAANGQVVGTALRDGPARTFRDGTVIRSGDVGMAGTARIAKEGGVPWVGDVGYEGTSRKADYNDAGFMARQNLHHFYTDLEYRTLSDWFVTRETHTRVELYGRTNSDGLVLAHGYQLNTSWKLSNFWELFVETHFRGRHYDDREVGDGTALERRELLGLEASLNTDPRRLVSAELFAQTQRIFDGVNFDASGTVTVRALPQLDFSLGPEIVYAAGEPRFVARAGDSLVFGKLKATELSGTFRATYTFTPRLSLQGYAQAFFDSGHYDGFGAFNGGSGRGIVVHRRDLVPTGAPATNPDFSDAALNVNLVLRWEYLLGSTVYLVYTRTQSPRIELLPGQRGTIDLGGLNRAPATDTILVKLTYFFG